MYITWPSNMFTEHVLYALQFTTTLETNIEKLSGSPVQVNIDSISAGSVKVASTVIFLNGNSDSASAYQTAMTSGTASASIFGTSFGSVAVDASSVKPSTVANPSKTVLTVQFDVVCRQGIRPV